MTSVSEVTKPDNLLAGFMLLLIVERRSGNLDHHPNFATCVCLMKLDEFAFIIAVSKIL